MYFRYYLPNTKGCLVPRLKLDQWILRRRFLSVNNVFSLLRGVAPYFYKLEFPLPKDVLCQIWLKLAQWFQRRRFLNVDNLFSLFHYHLPLGKSVTFHLNKSKSPSCLHPSFTPSLVKIGSNGLKWVWRRIQNVNIFYIIYCYYLPLVKGLSLICVYLNPLYPKMLCAKFG